MNPYEPPYADIPQDGWGLRRDKEHGCPVCAARMNRWEGDGCQ